MKSKIVIMSASVLFATGVAFHAANYCPLQHLMHAASSAQNVKPAATPAPAQPTLTTAKTSLVKR